MSQLSELEKGKITEVLKKYSKLSLTETLEIDKQAHSLGCPPGEVHQRPGDSENQQGVHPYTIQSVLSMQGK